MSNDNIQININNNSMKYIRKNKLDIVRYFNKKMIYSNNFYDRRIVTENINIYSTVTRPSIKCPICRVIRTVVIAGIKPIISDNELDIKPWCAICLNEDICYNSLSFLDCGHSICRACAAILYIRGDKQHFNIIGNLYMCKSGCKFNNNYNSILYNIHPYIETIINDDNNILKCTRCNYIKPKNKLYMSSCGHILCNDCSYKAIFNYCKEKEELNDNIVTNSKSVVKNTCNRLNAVDKLIRAGIDENIAKDFIAIKHTIYYIYVTMKKLNSGISIWRGLHKSLCWENPSGILCLPLEYVEKTLTFICKEKKVPIKSISAFLNETRHIIIQCGPADKPLNYVYNKKYMLSTF